MQTQIQGEIDHLRYVEFMTRRDQFAMAALAGVLTDGFILSEERIKQHVESAWKLADAMLKAREAI